jgi:hypothetical protein
VYVGLAIALHQIAKSQEAFHPFTLWEFPQTANDGRIYTKQLSQASLGVAAR